MFTKQGLVFTEMNRLEGADNLQQIKELNGKMYADVASLLHSVAEQHGLKTKTSKVFLSRKYLIL